MGTIMPINRPAWLMPVILILALLASCRSQEEAPDIAASDSEATAIPRRTQAAVEAIEISQNDAVPVQVSVIARGHLANDCTTIDQISQEQRGGTFLINIDSVEYVGDNCSDNPLAFEESVVLDTLDLPAGIYVVDVNGLQGTFKLQRDNVRDDGNAVLGGVVWLDSCNLPDLDDGQEVILPAGCIDLGEGRYRGDGLRASEEGGIGGVKVHLGAGGCPSSGLATTLTAPDGTFLFSGLTAGDYCLTVANDDQSNSILLAEGIWTYPEGASGQYSLALTPGESNLDVSFGWTTTQVPPEPVFFATLPADCTNQALFVADVTVPDNTPFAPGETFTKTWQLQNLGSCTWDPSYSLEFAGGELMDAPESVPITITVPPGEIGDLSVRLVAPATPGIYRSEWQLVDADGASFGIGPGSDRPFWAQIVVVEVEAVG